MNDRTRIVFDTNALISRLLLPGSVPGEAVRLVARRGLILLSDATFRELGDVLKRRNSIDT
jgi:predicted nucleic acid-binding protein